MKALGFMNVIQERFGLSAAWQILAGMLLAGLFVGCKPSTMPDAVIPVEESKSSAKVDEEPEAAKPLEAKPAKDKPAVQDAPATETPATAAPAEGSPASAVPAEATEPSTAAQEKPKEKGTDGVPAGGRPLADREKPKPGEAYKISFDDLIIGMQADIPFRPWMMEGKRAEELDGQKVRISGLMHGGAAGQNKIKEFVLLRNLECKFGPGGQADHLARIQLAEGEKTQYTNKTLIVEGRLHIDPYAGPDGNTWAIYRISEAKLK